MKIVLSGQGVAPISSVAQSDAGYGLVGVGGTASVAITNTGDGNLSGRGTESNLNGALSEATGDFVGAARPVSLPDGASQVYDFTCKPTSRGQTLSTTVTANFDNGSPDGANAATPSRLIFP